MRLLVILLSLLLGFSSCSVIQQKYAFQKDGSGQFEMGTDMSQMISMIEMMSAMEEKKEDGEKDKDPMKDLFKNMGERMDTIFSMEEIMPDSVRGTAKGEAMKSWKIRMLADKEKQMMYMGMQTDFESLTGLSENFKAIEEMDTSQDAGNPMDGMSTLSSNYFKNNVALGKNFLKIKAYSYTDEEMKDLKGMLGEEGDPMAAQMVENMMIKTSYQLPGKIKKVKYDGEYEKLDANTIETTYSYKSLLEDKGIPKLMVKWK